MNKQKENHTIDVLFVLGLFCLFALTTIFLISIGADIYSKTTASAAENFNDRTSFAYVTEKIRQADCADQISVEEIDGVTALCLKKTVNGTAYITWLYAYDGYLRELLVRADTPLSPEAGQTILPATSFSAEMLTDSLLTFEITNENRTDTLTVSLKTDSMKTAEGGSHAF